MMFSFLELGVDGSADKYSGHGHVEVRKREREREREREKVSERKKEDDVSV